MEPFRLPAPYLKRLWLDRSLVHDAEAYPFCLPFLKDGFELTFGKAITIIVGENGTGKSTLLEGIAALAGYDEAGGGKGYRPVDHSRAIEVMGGKLSEALRGSWLPKITSGWFFSRGKLLLRCSLPRPVSRGRWRSAARLPLSFSWGGLSSFL